MKIFKVQQKRDKEVLKAYIDSLPDGRVYDVIVKLHRERRTLPQNSLFHLWCKCIEDETGTETENAKRLLKEMFLGYREVEVFGRKSYELTSTTGLNTLQMSEFMNKVQAWASSELGIVLPIPEDLYFSHFVEQYKDK